jgi:hypothetical protein
MAVNNNPFRLVHQAIKAINPSAEYVLKDSSDNPSIDNDTCTIEWHKGSAISKADIKTKVAEIEPLDTVINNRLKEYPKISEQLDEMYHNGFDAWKAKIKAIKDKYPK